MDCDAIVIGAGIAGLRAAHALQARGLGVLVVEARDRAGGRIHTVRTPGHPPLERGAEFVHGRPRALMRLARRGGAKLARADGTHLARFARGDGRLVDVDRELARAMATFAEIDPLPQTPIARELERTLTGERDARVLALARSFAEGFYAADPDTASALAIATMARAEDAQHGSELRRVTEGYDTIVDALARGLSIRFSSPVSEVRWRRGRVDVVGLRDKASARVCVVALPLGVLAHGDVTFTPPLARPFGALEMGDVVKVLLRFRDDVPWARRDFAFLHGPELAFPTFWRVVPFDVQTLVGWVGGPRASALSEQGTAAIIDAALASLESLLGVRDVARFLDAAHVADWRRDRFARGAYAVVPAGSEAVPAQLAQPIADTLFFAGEHTEPRFLGTVHGALASGDRAAQEVLDVVRGRAHLPAPLAVVARALHLIRA